MRAPLLSALLVLGACGWLRAAPAHAQDRALRVHYYEVLRKDPLRALGWEALLPGAGSLYTHMYANAIVTFGLSVSGASLWTYGALADDRRLFWIGASTFAAARTYGMVSAPVGAALLNAAFRRQLRLSLRF